MELLQEIKNEYFDFLKKSKDIINGTFQYSVGKPLYPDQEQKPTRADLENEIETTAENVARKILQLQNEISELTDIEGYILYGGATQNPDEIKNYKNKLDALISKKLSVNGGLKTNQTETENLTTNQTKKIGLLLRSGIIGFLRENYKVSDNQISGFLELITKEPLKKVSINPHLSEHNKRYAIQNEQDRNDLDLMLQRFGISPKNELNAL